MSQELTIKQEKFVLKYFECGNASEAYRYAYSASKMKDSTVWEKSSLMLKNDKVRARLKELRAKAEEKSQWTIEKIIKAYTRIFEMGIGDVASSHLVTEGAGEGISNTIEVNMRDTNLASAKSALVEIGKLLGYYEKDNKQKSGDISIADFAEDFYNRQQKG
jgi:hypothetical protein